MNIYLYELRKRALSTLIWALSVSAFVLMYFSFFEAFADNALVELIDDFPDAFMKAFGLDADISTVMGFFGAVVAFVVLVASIYACSLGINIVSEEERDLTADFLIPKPVTRTTILSAKILAGLTQILVFTALTAAASVASIELFRGDHGYSIQVFALVYLGVFLLELLFFTMGLLVSVSARRLDSPFPFSFGIPVGFFILNSFDTLLQDTFLRFLIPYDYFNAARIVESSSLKTYGVVVSAILVALFTAGTFVLYRRRNIATAM